MKRYEYDSLFKFVLVGNCDVGKSSLLLRFVDDDISQKYMLGMAVDFRIKSVPIKNRVAMLQIWDTAGQ